MYLTPLFYNGLKQFNKILSGGFAFAKPPLLFLLFDKTFVVLSVFLSAKFLYAFFCFNSQNSADFLPKTAKIGLNIQIKLNIFVIFAK